MSSPYGICPLCDSPDVVRAVRSQPNHHTIAINMFHGIQTALLICLHCGDVRERVEYQNDLDQLRKRYGDQLS